MRQSELGPYERVEKVLKHSEPGGPAMTNRMTSEEMIHELALVFQDLQKSMAALHGEISHLRSRALRKV
jgi:hypothetical protein